MPWTSDKQRKWGNSPAGIAALGQAKVDEFNAASKGLKLPTKIDKPKNVVRHQSKYQGTPYVVPANVR
jgi:hypothetical protein